MAKRNTILDRWSITADDLTAAIDENPSLRGMLLGYVAEYKLRTLWFTDRPGVTHYVKHDDHNRKKKSDLVVTYNGVAHGRIEILADELGSEGRRVVGRQSPVRRERPAKGSVLGSHDAGDDVPAGGRVRHPGGQPLRVR
jgi:hypothetical protein